MFFLGKLLRKSRNTYRVNKSSSASISSLHRIFDHLSYKESDKINLIKLDWVLI